MTIAITPVTAADGTFSAAGAAAWSAGMNGSMATARLLGRTTAGAGAFEELTAAGAKSLLAIASGDVSGLGSLATVSNLTGPITSVGAATTIAASPALTTPIIASYTFATLPSAAANSGAVARVTDIGPATAGSLWVSNGTVWKPVNGRLTLATLASRFNRAAGAGEAVAFQFQLPASFLATNLDRLRVYCTQSKAGTTTTGTLGLRVGTAGTTGDTLITGTGGVILSAANRSVGLVYDLVRLSSTSIVKAGTAGTTVGSYSSANAAAMSAATTVSDTSNSLWVNVTITPGATDDVALEDAFIEFICA